MNIIVVPRAMVQHFTSVNPFLWITMTDPGKDFVETPEHFGPSLVARLAFRFWDSEVVTDMPGGYWGPLNPPPALPLEEAELFQPQQAQKIVDFVRHYTCGAGQVYIDTILVNCEGGHSRSPAVGAALAHIMGLKDLEMSLLRSKSPNGRVYTAIIDAA